MTQQQALKRAQAFYGKRAAVQGVPSGARIGQHGEFLEHHYVNSQKDSPKLGRYRCSRCSTEAVDEAGDLIICNVWHRAGGLQTSYRVGYIDSLFGAFNIQVEAASWGECFATLEARKAARAAERAARVPA